MIVIPQSLCSYATGLIQLLVLDPFDLVVGLEDEDVEPDAEIGGDHVHEAETRDQLLLVDVHLFDIIIKV